MKELNKQLTRAQQLGITTFPYHEYDDKGNTIYTEYGSEFWEEMEYNKRGNLTLYKTASGYQKKLKYDHKSRKTYEEVGNPPYLKVYIEYNDEDGSKTIKYYSISTDKKNTSFLTKNGRILEFSHNFSEIIKYDMENNVIEYQSNDGSYWSKEQMSETPNPYTMIGHLFLND